MWVLDLAMAEPSDSTLNRVFNYHAHVFSQQGQTGGGGTRYPRLTSGIHVISIFTPSYWHWSKYMPQKWNWDGRTNCASPHLHKIGSLWYKHQVQLNGFDAITLTKALAVSDWSFQHNSGIATWNIKGHTSTNHCTGSMLFPGMLGDQSSFWSRAADLCGLLLILW